MPHFPRASRHPDNAGKMLALVAGAAEQRGGGSGYVLGPSAAPER
jgi:hypothetical protein